MQKKQLFLAIFAGIFLIFGLFSSISFERVYDYGQIEQKINSISLSQAENIPITLTGSANSFILALKKSDTIDPNTITVRWNLDGKFFVRQLDIEDSDQTDYWYTFPLVTSPRENIEIQVFGYNQEDALLVATNSTKSHIQLTFHVPFALGSSGIFVVTRDQWGADESLRYVDTGKVLQDIREWSDRGKVPKIVSITESDQDLKDKNMKMGERMALLHPDAFSIQAKIRYENGRKLIWPIMRAKQIDRIVLHHTAETISQSSMDDKLIMRSMYMYHARTRGWGDIGYNFVIGRDGTIYEGRAGGAYVEGAHAYLNNLGTVGVALIGNFQQNSVPTEQYASLENFLIFLAKKYGINVLEDTIGFRVCSSGSSPDCLMDERTVKRLTGHRDVGYTSCPGAYLYNRMDDLRLRVARAVGNVTPVNNPEPYFVEPIPPEDIVQYVISGSVIQNSAPSTIVKSTPPTSIGKSIISIKNVSSSLGGKNIKIKLSYPDVSNIELSSATNGVRNVSVGTTRIPPIFSKNIKVGIVGNNLLSIQAGKKVYTGSEITYKSAVVRIDSWSRVPTWDTTGKYDDNLFRGTIRIRNQDGKLLVINELPLEDYLRGLGEVSNSDNIQKIKTIVVAARSYALFYLDPKNRKYNTTLYDGSDNPDEFQRYLGYGYELRSPLVSAQVRATRREVVTYSGSLVKVWYFSSSDGQTLSYQQYCQSLGKVNCEDVPYLQSVDDPAGVGKTRSGHGVGISGIGSTYFATQGWDYKKIIQYYLKGVEIMRK